MDDTEKLVETFKDLSDLEYEIVFIDSVYKKLKSVTRQDIRTTSALFIYMSVVETLKKYKNYASVGNRTVPHEDVVDLVISKGESFLRNVANDESKAPYTCQSITDLYDIVKDLWYILKSELLDTPEYAYLKPENTE